MNNSSYGTSCCCSELGWLYGWAAYWGLSLQRLQSQSFLLVLSMIAELVGCRQWHYSVLSLSRGSNIGYIHCSSGDWPVGLGCAYSVMICFCRSYRLPYISLLLMLATPWLISNFFCTCSLLSEIWLQFSTKDGSVSLSFLPVPWVLVHKTSSHKTYPFSPSFSRGFSGPADSFPLPESPLRASIWQTDSSELHGGEVSVAIAICHLYWRNSQFLKLKLVLYANKIIPPVWFNSYFVFSQWHIFCCSVKL